MNPQLLKQLPRLCDEIYRFVRFFFHLWRSCVFSLWYSDVCFFRFCRERAWRRSVPCEYEVQFQSSVRVGSEGLDRITYRYLCRILPPCNPLPRSPHSFPLPVTLSTRGRESFKRVGCSRWVFCRAHSWGAKQRIKKGTVERRTLVVLYFFYDVAARRYFTRNYLYRSGCEF